MLKLSLSGVNVCLIWLLLVLQTLQQNLMGWDNRSKRNPAYKECDAHSIATQHCCEIFNVKKAQHPAHKM